MVLKLQYVVRETCESLTVANAVSCKTAWVPADSAAMGRNTGSGAGLPVPGGRRERATGCLIRDMRQKR